MTGYHVTTPAKMARYCSTGCILPPVRYWRTSETARRWAQKTGRRVILEIKVPAESYPMPDHQPPMMAWWTPMCVRRWNVWAPEEAV